MGDRRSVQGQQQVELTLKAEEASDYLNFVIKDTSADVWYDQKGSNFHIPLNGTVATMSIDEQVRSIAPHILLHAKWHGFDLSLHVQSLYCGLSVSVNGPREQQVGWLDSSMDTDC